MKDNPKREVFYYKSHLEHRVGDLIRSPGGYVMSPVEYRQVDTASKTLRQLSSLLSGRSNLHSCPYCRSPIQKYEHDFLEARYKATYEGTRIGGRCQNCFWWYIQIKSTLDDDLYDHLRHDVTTFEGIICRFDQEFWGEAISLAEEEISEYRKPLSQLSPTTVEKLVAEILCQYHQCEVHHVGRAGDKGIDLLVIRGDSTIAVQVKHRPSGKKTESVAPVREFIGAMVVEGYKRGLFVTTAEKFSRSAEATARKATRNLAPLNLVSVHDLRKMIGNIASNQWVEYTRVWEGAFKSWEKRPKRT